MNALKKINKAKVKNFIFGSQEKQSIFIKIVLYLILCGVGFVFLYPLLMIFSGSMMDMFDKANPLVNWIPTKINIDNFTRSFQVLGGFRIVGNTFFYMFLFAVAQTVSSALVGYGLAKYDFFGKGLLFIIVIVTFILPPQTTFLPKYIMFKSYNMLGTIWPVLLPSALGQGIKSSIFILIFWQFFKMSPKSLDEAAYIDGAGHLKTFFVINLKMAVPAIIIVFIFSFVWNWNETYVAGTYFTDKIMTLPLALEKFQSNFDRMFPQAKNNPLLKANEGVIMAGTLLSVLPLIFSYVLVERKMVESFDKAGITGE